MTKVNNYDKIRNSRNELEATLRIRGISKRRFGRICNVKGTTIDKYIENPHMLRYYHMRRIANFLNIDVRDIIDIIEIDLPEGELIIKGEEGFNLVDAIPSKYRNKELSNE
jgi:transcriptional regulator with XRE-family HTH domain